MLDMKWHKFKTLCLTEWFPTCYILKIINFAETTISLELAILVICLFIICCS